jgi:hypothetical protein
MGAHAAAGERERVSCAACRNCTLAALAGVVIGKHPHIGHTYARPVPARARERAKEPQQTAFSRCRSRCHCRHRYGQVLLSGLPGLPLLLALGHTLYGHAAAGACPAWTVLPVSIASPSTNPRCWVNEDILARDTFRYTQHLRNSCFYLHCVRPVIYLGRSQACDRHARRLPAGFLIGASGGHTSPHGGLSFVVGAGNHVRAARSGEDGSSGQPPVLLQSAHQAHPVHACGQRP